MPLPTAQHVPTATYRLQLHKDFPFARVEELASYFEALGFSDLYFSPIFEAVPGSTHGYDVCDVTRINPELGGEDGFAAAMGALQRRGMGCLLDFVPNHMGIAGSGNRWFRDVLENGPQSRHARSFDIEWHPRHEALQDKILVPILGDYYGRILEKGELRLEREGGRFFFRYWESRFPLRPQSVPTLLDAMAAAGCADPEGLLGRVRGLFQILPEPGPQASPDDYTEREGLLERARAALEELLARPAAARALEAVLAELNGRPGEAASFDRLHGLLETQHYRLAFWKTGAHETNYRRFFAIDTLIGLRVEDGRVLRESHAKLAELVGRGLVRGVRLDHIDGLWSPADYLGDFHAFCTRTGPHDPALYVVVEKILAHDEELPAAWPVHGTTGYEFIAQLGGLFADPAAEAAFSRAFASFTGIAESAADLVHEKKRFVLEELFANAIGNLALGIDQIVEFDRRWRDLTMHDLRVAVREIVAALAVYRTYRRPGQAPDPGDAARIEAACAEAKRRNRALDPVPFEFVRDLLLGRYREDERARALGKTGDVWTLKFQQATGAVMAKSVEDTAFYVFNRCWALNEVGCEPGRFGADAEAFHRLNAARRERGPHSMLTTSTHDTKVSEDVRARLYALTERPERWEANLAAWAAHNRPFKTEVEGQGRLAPDANEEYLLYQYLLGAWPPGMEVPSPEFAERMWATMRKAVSEAKVNTNWIQPNQPWLEAVDRFLARLLDPASGFLALFLPEARALAEHGMVNSLSQVVLKATSPGMPDFYQGNEGWQFDLVDPDNRRPVDYAARQALLAGLDRRAPAELLANWADGGIKLHLTRALLRFRRDHPALFQEGDYRPVAARGPWAENVVAFTRTRGGETLLAVVPRFPSRVGLPPVGDAWGDTRLEVRLPEGAAADLFTGAPLLERDSPRLADLLAVLPCAVVAIGA